MLSETINKITPDKRASVFELFFFLHSSMLTAPMVAKVSAYPLTGKDSIPSLAPNKLIVPTK